MTYDYSVAKVGPLGPITWAERTVQYAISIMPASKVFVGVPGYGRDWVTAVKGVCPANVAKSVKVGAKAATFVMRNALSLAATYGATPIYNEQFGEVTFSYEKVYSGDTAGGLSTSCTASRTAWFQDARSWALRAALVNKYRIGGITAWTLGMEEPLAMESIRTVAKEIAPDQVKVVATIDSNEINYGQPLSISAQFTIKDNSPLTSLPIRIEGKSLDESDWRTLGTALTDAEGKFEKLILLGKSTTIRIFSDATWERSEGISTEFPILVKRLVIANPPTSVRAGAPFDLVGHIRPRTEQAELVIEKLVGKKWQVLQDSLFTDAEGNFIAKILAEPRGVITLRISLKEDLNWQMVSSQSFNIIVR